MFSIIIYAPHHIIIIDYVAHHEPVHLSTPHDQNQGYKHHRIIENQFTQQDRKYKRPAGTRNRL